MCTCGGVRFRHERGVTFGFNNHMKAFSLSPSPLWCNVCRCYECGEYGHLSFQCPKNVLGDRSQPEKKKKKRKREAEGEPSGSSATAVEQESDGEEDDDWSLKQAIRCVTIDGSTQRCILRLYNIYTQALSVHEGEGGVPVPFWPRPFCRVPFPGHQ